MQYYGHLIRQADKTLIVSANALEDSFNPVFKDIRERSTVADRFIDKDLYRVYIATLWSNVVLSPEEVGLSEDDLEDLHDESLHTVFKFISSKDGERAMAEARLTQSHKDLLQYFASMILDPSGHKKFMDQIRDKQQR